MTTQIYPIMSETVYITLSIALLIILTIIAFDVAICTVPMIIVGIVVLIRRQ